MKPKMWVSFGLVLACMLLVTGTGQAQTAVQVFLQRGQPDQLQFVDMYTGEIDTVAVSGERYTVFGSAVMYYDPVDNRVRLATADGRVRNHPFIQPLADTRRVDWVLSGDGKYIAWTLTAEQGGGQLVTTTRIAGIDGSSPREVLVDGPRPAIRALPVAFSGNADLLYMDYQPDGIGEVTPFQQYAGLFAVDLETGETAMLPGEPGCFCAAEIGAGLLLRLHLAENLSGFDVVVTNLGAETTRQIDAVGRANYTQAGGIVLAPDSTQAVYALAQVSDFGGASQSVRTVFVQVDLVERRQTVLTQPVNNFLQPVAWTEDNTAVIVTSADRSRSGTWKVTLADGRVTRVATATLLGTLH